jgi:hypothetical protein
MASATFKVFVALLYTAVVLFVVLVNVYVVDFKTVVELWVTVPWPSYEDILYAAAVVNLGDPAFKVLLPPLIAVGDGSDGLY